MSYHQILNIIIFNRNVILKVTILSTIFLFLLLYFVYPLTYRAEATILPPSDNPSPNSLSAILSGSNFTNLLTGGSSGNSQLYMEILKSRSASEYVVKKNNLYNYLDSKNLYSAAEKLSKKLNVEVTKEGIIKLNIDVKTKIFPMIFDNTDSVRKFAAELTNSFVDALDKMNKQKLSSKAKRGREYIESQLKITKASLDSVENALSDFQKKNKTFALPQQITASLDAAARLKSEITKTEIEIGMLKQNLREDNKAILSLQNKLSELKQQYSKMEMGSQDYLLAFKDVPALGKELTELLREVKIQNEVYQVLQQQYYQELIQENKDIPTIEVLDEAIPPLKASEPRVVFSSALGGVFVFLLMSLIFIYKEKKLLVVKQ